jgi:hypothetical protein
MNFRWVWYLTTVDTNTARNIRGSQLISNRTRIVNRLREVPRQPSVDDLLINESFVARLVHVEDGTEELLIVLAQTGIW